MASKAKAKGMFDGRIVGAALVDALRKLDPRALAKNPEDFLAMARLGETYYRQLAFTRERQQSQDITWSDPQKTAGAGDNRPLTQLRHIQAVTALEQSLLLRPDQFLVHAQLADLYGSDVKKAIKRSQATRWNTEARTLGAFSAAAPGGQGARKILMEPLQNAIWFAGEAAHETLWGTVGGAWESGERAADAVLHRLGGGKEAAETTGTPARPAPRYRTAPRYYRQ